MKPYVPLFFGLLSGCLAVMLLHKKLGTLRACLLLVIWMLAADSSLPTIQYSVYSVLRWPSQSTWLRASRGIPVFIQLLACLVIAIGCWRDEKSGRRTGHCANCGYDLTGNVTGVCPECGNTEEPKCQNP